MNKVNKMDPKFPQCQGFGQKHSSTKKGTVARNREPSMSKRIKWLGWVHSGRHRLDTREWSNRSSISMMTQPNSRNN